VERISIDWSLQARADLRAIDREIAMQILHCIDDYISRRVGNVKKLKHPETGFRLRCGTWRVFFDFTGPIAIRITKVKPRKDAYR
jgi:mRNA-degrading endonuclease RelE of RelBE toxin-antitoxin system